MSVDVDFEESIKIVDHYSKQLKNLGYEWKQSREIVICGLRGYLNKCDRREKAGETFYRKAGKTVNSRVRKKLLEKTSWFKSKKKEIGKFKTGKGFTMEGKTEKTRNKQVGSNTTKSVVYVQQTRGSNLAKKMREEEEMLEKLTGYRLKVVERAGDSLEGLLHRSNPWSGADCAREKCLLCETKQVHPKYENQNCSKRNVVYETWCESCRLEEEEKSGKQDGKKDQKLYKYIGESSRSCFERGREHQSDLEQLKPTSHMLKHVLDKHEGRQPGEVKFLMRAIKFHKSSFERQIQEAVLIQANRTHHLLNSKSEFNRCALPRLGTKLGERETKEKREEVEEE